MYRVEIGLCLCLTSQVSHAVPTSRTCRLRLNIFNCAVLMNRIRDTTERQDCAGQGKASNLSTSAYFKDICQCLYAFPPFFFKLGYFFKLPFPSRAGDVTVPVDKVPHCPCLIASHIFSAVFASVSDISFHLQIS